MNILNCMLLKWNAGTENAFLTYAKALQELNFNVINLVHKDAQIIPALEKNNLSYIKSLLLGSLGKYDIFTLIYFKYLIKKHRINLVIAHHGRVATLFKKLRNKNLKVIVVNHGVNPKHSVGSDFAINLNSHNLRETIRLGQDKSRAGIMPNSLEDSQNIVVKKSLNEVFTIGSFGRFSPEKGYPNLIEALNILNQKNLDFRVFIGGDGEEKNIIEDLIAKYNLEKKVKLTGWVLDKSEFFSKIDLFILPSNKEEFGLVLLEAMLYKTLILATSCHGPNDIIIDGENGFLCEINNPKLMAEKIIKIIKINNANAFISKASQDLQSKFSYDNFKKMLFEILSKNNS